MNWLFAAILAYFLFAIVALGDKYLLSGSIKNPKVYTFFIAITEISVICLIPFVSFQMSGLKEVFLGLTSGIFFIAGVFWYSKSLQIFEPSRIIPAIGGMQPIFTLVLIYIFSMGKEKIGFWAVLSIFLLISGIFFINYDAKAKISSKSLKLASISAILFSLHFVLAKYVYISEPFWTGFIMIRIGGVIAGLYLLFFGGIWREIFGKRENFISTQNMKNVRTAFIFISNQIIGIGSSVLQNWSVALAPLVYVAAVNALQGVQYVFLFIFSALISLKFPNIFKEDISRKIIFQKTIAILIIGAGLAILTFK